jgi:hypothetical protein
MLFHGLTFLARLLVHERQVDGGRQLQRNARGKPQGIYDHVTDPGLDCADRKVEQRKEEKGTKEIKVKEKELKKSNLKKKKQRLKSKKRLKRTVIC